MDESGKEKSKTKEPKVEIFGEDIDSRDEEKFDFHHHHHCHHHHHGSLTWGLILILVGALFLLSNFGVLSPVVWSQVIHLWPVLIILIGVDTLIGHSEVSDIINSLIGLFILATLLGVVLIHTSPQIMVGLPHNIQNYLHSVNNYFQIK